MESKKLLTAIVALLIVASIASISTISVNATHTPPTASVTPNRVKYNDTTVFTMRVNNTGGDKIQRVQITMPGGFSAPEAAGELPADSMVELVNNNNVTLPESTVVTPTDNILTWLKENTVVIRENGTRIFLTKGSKVGELRFGAAGIKIIGVDQTPPGWRGYATWENITPTDNLRLLYDKAVTLTDNDVSLENDTRVVMESDNIGRLPDNAMVKKLGDNETLDNFDWNDNLYAMENILVTMWDNLLYGGDNNAVLAYDIQVYNVTDGTVETWAAGENIQLVDGNNVIITEGTQIQPFELGWFPTSMTISENTEMIREEGSRLFYGTVPIKALPESWTWDGTDTWSTDNADAMINSTSSYKDFVFVSTTPTVGGLYTFTVKTTDNGTPSDNQYATFSVYVDNEEPYIKSISISPDPAKGATAVTITIVASENLAKLDNVMVAENNAPANTQVTMTSADKITWTGTYTTDNENTKRDGLATVTVIGAKVEDLVGLTQSGDNTKTFTVDRMLPPKPSAAYGVILPTGITRSSSYAISGRTADNILGTIVENIAGMKVKIRVGTSVTEITAGVGGAFSQVITLSQGRNEVGVRFVDLAGNEGPENTDNIFLDSQVPTISMNTLSGHTFVEGMETNDNTPTILLTITDPGYPTTGLGVENDPARLIVKLLKDDNTLIAILTNALTWDKTTGQFENAWSTELTDNYYRIYVFASDNLNSDNKVFRFKIDTTPPAAPTLSATASQNPLAPDIKTNTTVSLGGTAEPGATIRIWTSPDPFTSETNVENVVAGADGTWTASITIAQGVTVRIRASQVDTAGNESTTKVTYGYLKVDASAPVVVITAPATGTKTDKATITVSGTVTKDAWESYDKDITLRLQNGVTSTSIVIPLANDGTFSVNVTLAEGKNSIIATATDSVSNSTSYTVTVERTVTSWAIYAIILVIIALILAAIAIFRMR